MSATHLRGAIINRSNQPGLLNPLRQSGRKTRRARVAGLQLVHRSGQVLGNPRRIDLEVAQNTANVRVRTFHKLEQKMLRLDIIVGAREAKPSCPFEGAPTSTIEPGN